VHVYVHSVFTCFIIHFLLTFLYSLSIVPTFYSLSDLTFHSLFIYSVFTPFLTHFLLSFSCLTTGVLKVWNTSKSKCVFRSTETNTNDRFLFADYVKAQDAILAVTEDCNIYFYGRKDMALCKEIKQVR